MKAEAQAVSAAETPTPAFIAARRRAVLGAGIGTVIEWYDFLLYASASALVFNRLFFPKADPLTGAMLAFSTYALGFLARPLGAVVFGHLGDRIGRKRLLMASLIIMGAATFAIGLLPTFAQAGFAAPILLTLLRLVQGFGVGGEWGGAILMAAEYADRRRRGFWCGLPQAGGAIGNLLATGVLTVLSAVQTDQQFLGWGWRVPFLLSVVLIAVGWWVRNAVEESPLFEAAVRREGAHAAPVVEVLKRRPKAVAIGAGLKLAENVSYYVLTAFSLTYVTEIVKAPRTYGLAAVVAGGIAGVVAIPIWSWLSDRLGRRPVYAFGAAAVGLWSFAFFPLVATGQAAAIVAAVMVGVALHSAMNGPQAAFIAELFPTRLRYSGASLSYQVPVIVGGSLAPIIAISLYRWTGSSVPISIYLLAICAITLAAALLAKETRGSDLAAADPEA